MRDLATNPSQLEAESTSARLYLIEFSDGEAIEIPAKYLRKEIE